jgi:Leucine-rich repeat (LRR) protein
MLESETANLENITHVNENSSSKSGKNNDTKESENETKKQDQLVKNSENNKSPDSCATLTTEPATQTQFMLFGPTRHSAVPNFLFTDKRYSALEVLILDFNCVTEIPSQISKLTSLQKFTAAFNQLTTLPIELFSLSSLTFLRVGYNRLTKLPKYTLFQPLSSSISSSLFLPLQMYFRCTLLTVIHFLGLFDLI